jgi:hypothetical protein
MSEPIGNVFRHCPNSDGSFVDPDIPDPLESEFVFVNTSNSYPDIGQGLFAKKSIPALTVVAFFGGRFVHLSEWEKMKIFEPSYWRIVDDNKVKIYKYFKPECVNAEIWRTRDRDYTRR